MSTYPFHYEALDEETNTAIQKHFESYINGLMRVQPFNLCINPEFRNFGEKIYNMDVRPNDVWIVTYPKTGTTWTQAAIWSVVNEGKLEILKENPELYNWRFIDADTILKDGVEYTISKDLVPEHHIPMVQAALKEFDAAVNDPKDKPRLVKTHFPFPFLPPKLLDTAKVIYIARNPRDVCVSYFHHHRLMHIQSFEGTFEEFFDYFIRDLTLYSPFWPHVIDAWSRRSHPNMLFMFYEDMKKDFPAALRKLATFLEKPLSEEMVEKLIEELSIEGMKKNPVFNEESLKGLGLYRQEGHFIRKGIIGDWKNYFTPEMEKRMEEWSKIGRHGSDIKFPGEE